MLANQTKGNYDLCYSHKGSCISKNKYLRRNSCHDIVTHCIIDLSEIEPSVHIVVLDHTESLLTNSMFYICLTVDKCFVLFIHIITIMVQFYLY